MIISIYDIAYAADSFTLHTCLPCVCKIAHATSQQYQRSATSQAQRFLIFAFQVPLT